MKPSTKDRIRGSLQELKGKVKQRAGEITNDKGLAARGRNESLAGKVRKKVGEVKKVFGR